MVRDAFRVCRTLDIRYLWINALCILQDSKQNWEEQSQDMSLIYEGASLTICVLASSSCMEKFPDERPAVEEYLYISPVASGPTETISLRRVQ